MQISEITSDGLKREYNVVVSASQLKKDVDNRLHELGQSVRMPGFRPGKVPMPVLKKHYEKSVLGEVLEHAVHQGSQQVVTEKALRPAGQPKIDVKKFEPGQDLEFSIAFEIVPEIVPIDFSKIALERDVVEVPESEIEENLEILAKRQRRPEDAPKNGPAASGDVVIIDYVGRTDGKEFDGGKGSDVPLELGGGSFIPGFEDQLIGKKAGDSALVKVTFPKDYNHVELAGKAAEFDVTVKEVKVLPAVPVDDELAKLIGMEDLAALKKAMRAQIEHDYEGAARARLKRQLLDILAEGHDFMLPEGVLQAEFDAIWRQIEGDRKAGRIDKEDEGKTEEVLRQEYRDIAARRVKLGLLLSEIGRQNDVKVPNEEITRAMVNEAQRFPGQEKKVIEYYQRSPEALNQLRAPLYEDKVIDHILGLAKVAERRVSAADFRAAATAEERRA